MSIALFMSEISDPISKVQTLESFSYGQSKVIIESLNLSSNFLSNFSKENFKMKLSSNLDPSLELKATVYANDQMYGITFKTLGGNEITIEKLFKINRREAFRYKIPQGYEIKVKVSNDLKTTTKNLKLYDLCVEGIGLKLEPGLNLKAGDKVFIEFSLNSKDITAEGEVRGIFKLKEGKEDILKIGIKFKKVSHFGAGYITSFINQKVSQYSKKI